jgi:ribosome-associated heat shock protein Hsp15
MIEENNLEGVVEPLRVRIDKWLWAARFYKTRALAIQAVEQGKVLINAERVRPARAVREGDTLSVRRGPYTMVLVVQALSLRRGPAVQAQLLYEETAQSIAARQELAERLALQPQVDTGGRPTKRARRQMTRFTDSY